MENNVYYSDALANVIMENFSVGQMKGYVHFNKMPRLIFHLKKDEKELKEYRRLDKILKAFNGKLIWGVFKCPRSKVNYIIAPLKWEKIERDESFKGEQYLVNDFEYLELIKLATADYIPLVEHLKANLCSSK